jgi:hypothetical protein
MPPVEVAPAAIEVTVAMVAVSRTAQFPNLAAMTRF